MTTEQINDWRYPPVPTAVREALRNHPELTAEIEDWLHDDDWRMSNSLSLYSRVNRLDWMMESLKNKLSDFSIEARAKLETAQTSGDAAATAAAQVERLAISEALNMDLEVWKEFQVFYGLEYTGVTGLQIAQGAQS